MLGVTWLMFTLSTAHYASDLALLLVQLQDLQDVSKISAGNDILGAFVSINVSGSNPSGAIDSDDFPVRHSGWSIGVENVGHMSRRISENGVLCVRLACHNLRCGLQSKIEDNTK